MQFPKDHGAQSPDVAARIIAGARQHFFAHGFRSVTMDDLAAELGMSKKTLYAHFRSKRDLLEAVMDEKFRDIERECERISFDRPGDFTEALRGLLSCVQRNADELRPAFLRDMRKESPDVFRRVEERREKVIQRYFGRLFEQGRKAGVVRKDIEPQLILAVLLGGVQAVANPAKLESLGLTLRRALDSILGIVFEGITAKGK